MDGVQSLSLTFVLMQTFQESLIAAGAGISLVDSVVMSQSKTLVNFFILLKFLSWLSSCSG